MATSILTCTVKDVELHTPLLKPDNHTDSQLGKYFAKSCSALREMKLSTMIVAMSSLRIGIHDVAMKDTAKTIHALKMALALVLAFLLVLVRAPYAYLGEHVVWAIMTVIVVFEFTIGATLSKGLNRGVGTLLAGLLAFAVGELACLMSPGGGVGHPILVGFSVFIIGGMVTFVKLQPSLKSYEFGFRTFLLTFSLIMVAEYRGDDPLATAINRFFIILLGAAIGISVNVFLLPCWAGNDLHLSLVANFYGVADSLEACVNEYLCGTMLKRFPSNIFMGKNVDDPVYKWYRSTLTSASKEESLAGFASWEPPHGWFKVVKYPWHQYVKVGAVLRHCAYSVVALHGCLQSAIQAPLKVREVFENEIRTVGIECALVLRKIGRQLEDRHKMNSSTLLQGVEHAIDQLQQRLYFRSYLLVREGMGHLGKNRGNVSVSLIPELTNDADDEDHGISTQLHSSDHLELNLSRTEFPSFPSKKCIKRMHTWPSRRQDKLDFAKELYLEQKVRILESASALSVGTFATLLMEVALRLDYVVEAVQELGELASFADAKDERDTDVKIQINGYHFQAIRAGVQL